MLPNEYQLSTAGCVLRRAATVYANSRDMVQAAFNASEDNSCYLGGFLLALDFLLDKSQKFVWHICTDPVFLAIFHLELNCIQARYII